MKKLAIFVEGQTEQIFVEKLLYYITNTFDICISKKRGFGGRNNGRRFITLTAPDIKAPYYILLVDSSNDGRVLTDIREGYRGLQKQGYDKIIGLRDVYPHSLKDFSKLKRFTKTLTPKGKLDTTICFAVLEVETWFIAEYKHFHKLHPQLTPQFIERSTGINPRDKNIEQSLIPEKNNLHNSPAADLDMIYKLVKRSYSKKKHQVLNVMKVINMNDMVNEVPKRVKSLAYFLQQLDDFFAIVQEAQKPPKKKN
jgi:hypothetical protein